MRRCTPGPNSTTRNTVPLSSVVPTLRAEPSSAPSLFTGKPCVVQTTPAIAPGRPCAMFFICSSIVTTALPFLSWPVTTRRSVSAIAFPPCFRRRQHRRGAAARQSAARVRISPRVAAKTPRAGTIAGAGALATREGNRRLLHRGRGPDRLAALGQLLLPGRLDLCHDIVRERDILQRLGLLLAVLQRPVE